MRTSTQLLTASLLSTVAFALPSLSSMEARATPVNPYAEHCPVPSSFIVSAFSSYTNLLNSSDPSNTASFRISYGSANLSSSYGNGAFYCPRADGSASYYDGKYDLLCDQDGMVRVFTDGASEVDLREWHYCDAAPANGKYKYFTIDTQANNVDISSVVTCTTVDNIRTCSQPTTGPLAQFETPVQAYALGGSMGYGTVTEDGVTVPASECPELGNDQNPVLVQREGCVHGVGSV